MPRTAPPRIALCAGTRCRRKGARKLLKAARKTLEKLGFPHPLVVTRSCRGQCKRAPLYAIDRGDWVPCGSPGDLKRELRRRARKLRRPA
jgi:NADH:ubiquinone oxidoreductase subunit E